MKCQIKYVTVKEYEEIQLVSHIVNKVITIEYTMRLSLKDSEYNTLICSNQYY